MFNFGIKDCHRDSNDEFRLLMNNELGQFWEPRDEYEEFLWIGCHRRNRKGYWRLVW